MKRRALKFVIEGTEQQMRRKESSVEIRKGRGSKQAPVLCMYVGLTAKCKGGGRSWSLRGTLQQDDVRTYCMDLIYDLSFRQLQSFSNLGSLLLRLRAFSFLFAFLPLSALEHVGSFGARLSKAHLTYSPSRRLFPPSFPKTPLPTLSTPIGF